MTILPEQQLDVKTPEEIDLPKEARVGSPNPFSKTRRLVTWTLALAILVPTIVGYGWIQTRLFTPGVIEADSAAYIWMAERIGFGLPLSEPDDDVFSRQEHIWVRNHKGEVLPKYAPGYPAMMGVAWRLFGEKAAFAISPIAGGIALVASFLLFLFWMSPPSAALAVLVLAISPMYLAYSGYVLTHGVDVAIITVAMAVLWRWMHHPGTLSGALGGLLLGLTPLIRHSNVLLALPAVAAVLVACFRNMKHKRGIPWLPIAAFGFAGLVFPFLLMRYNLEHFGSPWLSGYSLSNEQNAFEWGRLADNLAWLPMVMNNEGLPMVFGLGLVGIVVLGPPGDRFIRWLWVFPMMVLYSVYYWAHPGLGTSYIRFLFATFPTFVGAAFALLDDYGRRQGGITRWIIPLTAAIVFGLPNYRGAISSAQTLLANERAQVMASAAAPVSRHVLNESVVLTEPPFTWHIPGAHHPRVYDLQTMNPWRGKQLAREQGHRYEPRWQKERIGWILNFYEQSGSDTELIFSEKIRSMMAQGKPVVMIVPSRNMSRWQEQLGKWFEFDVLEKWPAPTRKIFPATARGSSGNVHREWVLIALSEHAE